jgi:hypothetical protein
MSEHQVYEFVALDRPLTEKQMAELRAISSRAEISPSRFWNAYDWGDLKADPAKLMERYFDAHLYFANWGTHRLMLRVPRARIETKALAGYLVGDTARMRTIGDHVVLDFVSEDEEPEYDDESQHSLAALTPLRAELMRGDLRVAYLGWLSAVTSGEVDDEAREPPVPPGLASLTAAQDAMIDWLRIDIDLVTAAAVTSAQDDDAAAFSAWVAKLPARAKDAWIRRAADDPELALGAELLRAFRARSKPRDASPRRTVGELRAAADAHAAAGLRAEAARAAKAKRTAEAAKTKRLDALAKRLDGAWNELEELVARSSYDAAITVASELRELAVRDGETTAFGERFDGLRKRQQRRRGFFDRWNRANRAAPNR